MCVMVNGPESVGTKPTIIMCVSLGNAHFPKSGSNVMCSGARAPNMQRYYEEVQSKRDGYIYIYGRNRRILRIGAHFKVLMALFDVEDGRAGGQRGSVQLSCSKGNLI